MKSLFTRFAKDESGATAIEYGLIAAGLAVVIITVFSAGRQVRHYSQRLVRQGYGRVNGLIGFSLCSFSNGEKREVLFSSDRPD